MIDKKSINTIYIISKGRPHCTTAKTLTDMGYQGEWFIVCGNNDETLPQYKKNWGDRVLVFDWYEQAKKSDFLDNFGTEKVSSGAVPVRNAVFTISKSRGEERHWQFDDDYQSFWSIGEFDPYNVHRVGAEELERKLYWIAQFGHEANIYNVGFSVPSESMPDSRFEFSKRVFNAHNMRNENPTEWKGRTNDDLINAIETHKKGQYELSFKFLFLTMKETQAESGGNTDIYQAHGTVRKTAYAILTEPKAVQLVGKFGRFHYSVNWGAICPRMIHEKWSKSGLQKVNQD